MHQFHPFRRLFPGLIALCLLAALLPPARPGRADVAPPQTPPGANLAPGVETTQVAMLAETVIFSLRRQPAPGRLAQADVSAVFTLRNLGQAEEHMAARFPLMDPSGEGDGFGNYPEIADLRARVDGRAVAARRVTTPNPSTWDQNAPPIAWAAFEVVFPPGKDVVIQVDYTAEATGDESGSFIVFNYILETGAGWKDAIGQADILVRLPYPANEQNVVDASTLYGDRPAPALAGNELHWQYTHLEPSRESNLLFTLVKPEIWTRVLAERDNTTRSPNDGEAWGRLGKACKEAIRVRKGMRGDAGGRALFNEALHAYTQAVRIKPKDALWHFGFAELLWEHAWLDANWSEEPEKTAAQNELAWAQNELAVSLALDPSYQPALDLWGYLTEKPYSPSDPPAAATLPPLPTLAAVLAPPTVTQPLPPATLTRIPLLQATNAPEEGPSATSIPASPPAGPAQPASPAQVQSTDAPAPVIPSATPTAPPDRILPPCGALILAGVVLALGWRRGTLP